MLTKEDFEKMVNETRDKLDKQSQALISEDMIGIMGNVTSLLETIETQKEDITKLQHDNDELLKVNGRLFQKIGFEKEKEKEEINPFGNENKVEKITIGDLINEKGEMI
jgi:hypothetical protein